MPFAHDQYTINWLIIGYRGNITRLSVAFTLVQMLADRLMIFCGIQWLIYISLCACVSVLCLAYRCAQWSWFVIVIKSIFICLCLGFYFSLKNSLALIVILSSILAISNNFLQLCIIFNIYFVYSKSQFRKKFPFNFVVFCSMSILDIIFIYIIICLCVSNDDDRRCVYSWIIHELCTVW